MKKRFTNYQEDLIKALKDPAEAQSYLNAALEDEDPRVFLLALKNVLEAKNLKFTQLAKNSDLSRENLYRILSLRGNPKLNNLKSILHSAGFQLQIQDVSLARR